MFYCDYILTLLCDRFMTGFKKIREKLMYICEYDGFPKKALFSLTIHQNSIYYNKSEFLYVIIGF